MGNNAGGNDCDIYEDFVCCPIITVGWTQNNHDKHQSKQQQQQQQQKRLVQIRTREI
jgi:hypothetical protein